MQLNGSVLNGINVFYGTYWLLLLTVLNFVGFSVFYGVSRKPAYVSIVVYEFIDTPDNDAYVDLLWYINFYIIGASWFYFAVDFFVNGVSFIFKKSFEDKTNRSYFKWIMIWLYLSISGFLVLLASLYDSIAIAVGTSQLLGISAIAFYIQEKQLIESHSRPPVVLVAKKGVDLGEFAPFFMGLFSTIFYWFSVFSVVSFNFNYMLSIQLACVFVSFVLNFFFVLVVYLSISSWDTSDESNRFYDSLLVFSAMVLVVVAAWTSSAFALKY